MIVRELDTQTRNQRTKLTLFGHAAISESSLLSGVKRKFDFEAANGNFWRQAVVGQIRDVGRVAKPVTDAEEPPGWPRISKR
jgi:hypothetical protein